MKLNCFLASYRKIIITLSFAVFFSLNIFSQPKALVDYFPDIDVVESNCPSSGYFFFSSEYVTDAGNKNYLAITDNEGTPVFFRTVEQKTSNFTLQANGYLTFISNDSIFVMDSSFINIDTITVDTYDLNRNDFILTESNHAIVCATEDVIKDMSAIVAGGDPNAVIKESVIQFLDENKNVDLTWNSSAVFDVLDTNEDSPFVNLTDSEIDYIGITDIEIDSDTSILVNCKYMDEITKVDIRTGDIIWRLGGKNNDFSFINDDTGFSQQSVVRKLSNGNLLIFDNGLLHESPVTSIVEYEIDELNKTVTLVNRFSHESNILVQNTGSVQKLDNDNILVSWGEKSPSLTEYNPNGTVALELDFSDHSYCNRIDKFEWKTDLFEPVVDTINFPFWDYTIYTYILILRNNSDEIVSISDVSNRSVACYTEQTFPLDLPANGTNNIWIRYFPETIPIGIIKDVFTFNVETENQLISRQVQIIGYRDDFINPVLETTPADGDINVSVDTKIYMDFGEPLRIDDGVEITYNNVSDLVSLRKGSETGPEVEISVAISTDKDVVTIIPKSKLASPEKYFLSLLTNLEDYYNLVLEAATIEFETGNANGIKLIKESVHIYPNPSFGYFKIESPDRQIESIDIYDNNGKMITNTSGINRNDYSIDLSDKTDGIYIVRIRFSNDEFSVHKIIKLK